MKNIFRVLVIVAAFATGQVMAQSTDGFSVGGVGTFGGTAVNPVTENGWGSLDDYRAARDCCQYTNSANDAQLWSDAGLADGGSTSRINGASCDAASYDKLRLTCGGKLCQATKRNVFLPMRDYDQVNHCLSPRYGSLSDYKAASSLGYGMNSADAGLWAETDNATYDPFCPASDCSTAQLSDFITAKNAYTTSLNAANTIVTALQDNSSISATDVSSLLTAQSLTADSDLDLNDNPIHLSYVQACMSGKTDPAQLAACAANVDGQDLNRYAVAEILSGSQSGTVDQTVLVSAGISSDVAQIAAGNTCGPNQDQSCLTAALGGIEGKADVTQANFETVLADYFTAAVAEEPTTVATHSVNTGCPGGETTFAVPNPPSLCASFANWNCSSNTTGISVVWNDSGKGNLLADTSSFAGGSYSLTARLVIGSTTRERPLTGTFNIQAMSAAKAAGYRTGSQPGYWGNPYNPLHRARNQCSAWGGTLAKYSEIRTANSEYGTIISDNTRVIFRAANGSADAHTGTNSSGARPQCSQFFKQGWNNIHNFYYSGNNAAKCNNNSGRNRFDNYTYLCKDIPVCE